MKKIFFVLSVLVSGLASCQTTGYFRYDTVTFQKGGGNSEFKLLNATRNVTGGVLTNIGNGRTAFMMPVSSLDTSNKWVNRISKNGAGDSLIYWIGTTRFAISDPSGGGGGTYTFSPPLSETGGTVSIANAAADGATKGAASFTAADFNSSSGLISIDYTNGQAANGSTKGFLTPADHILFSAKQAALSGSGFLFFTGTSPSYVPIIPIANGGTNITTWTTGDFPYASGTNVLAKRAAGTNGDILTMVGGLPTWTPAGGGGIATLNTLTATTQTFAKGTSPQSNDWGIVSSGSTHTFHFPDASATNRGLLTTADHTAFTNKINISDSSAMLAGYVRSSRLISTGYGLTGGGDLTTNRTHLFDSTTVFPQLRATIAFPVTGRDRFGFTGEDVLATAHRIFSGAGAYKIVFNHLPDAIGDTGFAVIGNGGSAAFFTPTPPNRNFADPRNDKGTLTIDARNLSENGLLVKQSDYGVTSSGFYNFYDSTEYSIAHGNTTAPNYLGVSSAVNVGFKNNTENIVLQLHSSPRRSAYADSGSLIMTNGRNLDFGLYGANNGNIRFGRWSNGMNEWGRFTSVNGFFGLGTILPTQQLTINGQVRINAINNASVFDSVVVINNGVLEARLASTLVTSGGIGGGLGSFYIDPTLRSINDSTLGGDTTRFWGKLATKYYTDSVFIGHTHTWNSLTDPTGTQTLSFGDNELNAWTNGSNTENFHTITSNSQTTGKTLVINSSSTTSGTGLDIGLTGTAAAGDGGFTTTQAGLRIKLSGTNATGAVPTFGINIENSHAGSSFNYGAYVNATGGAENNGGYFLASANGSANTGLWGLATGSGAATNIGGRFAATGGTNNYAILVPASSGRVGIGGNPDSIFHVVGGLKFVTGRQGAGKVLTSDANGGADWQTPSGGSGSQFPTQQSHTSGATVTISNQTTNIWFIVNPASTLAALTITMPASPVDGQLAEISFGGTITSGTVVTSLTISPNSGQTIINPPTAISADAVDNVSLRYKTSNTTWYRLN